MKILESICLKEAVQRCIGLKSRSSGNKSKNRKAKKQKAPAISKNRTEQSQDNQGKPQNAQKPQIKLEKNSIKIPASNACLKAFTVLCTY